MKNSEMFEKPEERAREFYEFCKRSKDCGMCRLAGWRSPGRIVMCSFAWLDLEADAHDETLEKCPACGCETRAEHDEGWPYFVRCSGAGCYYQVGSDVSMEEAKERHNGLARAVRENGGAK